MYLTRRSRPSPNFVALAILGTVSNVRFGETAARQLPKLERRLRAEHVDTVARAESGRSARIAELTVASGKPPFGRDIASIEVGDRTGSVATQEARQCAESELGARYCSRRCFKRDADFARFSNISVSRQMLEPDVEAVSLRVCELKKQAEETSNAIRGANSFQCSGIETCYSQAYFPPHR